MDHEGATAWVAGYEVAWRDGDIAGMRRLFTEDAEYWYDPYQPPEVGHEARGGATVSYRAWTSICAS